MKTSPSILDTVRNESHRMGYDECRAQDADMADVHYAEGYDRAKDEAPSRIKWLMIGILSTLITTLTIYRFH